MNYYSGTLDNDLSLKLSPLTGEQARMADPQFEGAGGYFLYKTRKSSPKSIEVLAQVHSDEAAFELSRLLGLD
ncbi:MULTISPECIES: hypothetical protein [unclassified Shinella]|uniref:hypothetical protein n=1 Tax=unclassified Shinella TaxID=2643062 RepID=UPI00225DB3A2|nr:MULTISPECIES: hypothetical protein [unclassified Shinella]MCO5140891.1 hypothetical protein [Shinella sp.]MDC7256418.1 hypothetical protein [Shinella sp. YE25]CAI0339284.1 conserved hypothetical protein [Rhizobiaceae bacterium]CAK7257695.1 conserved protein of unknown function [Shinella sp. WSC3-e]